MRVAITGHRPDSFLQSHYTQGQIQLLSDGMVATFKRQYDELAFNVGGALGADQIVGQSCIDAGVPYYLYLPFPVDIQGRYWKEEQREDLVRQFELAAGVKIVDPTGHYDVKNYFVRDRQMVDDADVVVAFWVGKKRGGTYEAMKYALTQSKFVLNALDGLRPVFSNELEKGWTPPTVQGE